MAEPLERMYVHAGVSAPQPRWTLRLDHATARDREHLGHARRSEHHHDVYHAVLVTSGRGSFLFAGEEVAVRAPWLFLISPGQPHSFQGGVSDDTVYGEATFSGVDRAGRPLRLPWPELMRERFGCPCPLPAHAAIAAPAAAAIGACIRELAQRGHAGGPHLAPLVDGLLAQLLFLIFRHLVAEPAAGAEGDAIDRARALIEARLGEPPSLVELAAAVGLSPKHLTRAFKRRHGLPPVAFRRRAAMEQAATLVRSSRLPLAEIAERLGFDDLPYFTRVFRQVHGEPPGRLRRRLLGGGGSGL